MIALCFFTGLCDGNVSSHSVISDQNTIKQCIRDEYHKESTLTRNFSNLDGIWKEICLKIIEKTNTSDVVSQQKMSAEVIEYVKTELMQDAGIESAEDPAITIMTASLITVVLLDLQELFHYDPIDVKTGLYYLYTNGEYLSKKLYLSDIFKINPTEAILVIPDPDSRAFTADIEQFSLASAIEECQEKIRKKEENLINIVKLMIELINA